MVETLKCISPVDGSVYVERPLADAAQVQTALELARRGHEVWRQLPVEERGVLLSRAVDAFVDQRSVIAEEIAWQMGRPVGQAGGEVAGFEERARYMIEVAPEVLADVVPSEKKGFTRFVQRAPLGVVFVVAPWNYPYLTAVNAVVPALMAGNAVVLKHSAQTPLCAERFSEAFMTAGLPEGVFQYLHLGHAEAIGIIESGEVDFVSFTGSVDAGHKVQHAAARHFMGVGLELGGKDPAYVRQDADIEHAVVNVMDGAFFNAGQSCCGIERVYVHADIYDRFLEAAAAEVKKLQLGNPTQPDTSIGPMVRTAAADFVREQTAEAVAAGARALIDPKSYEADAAGTPYLAPQILADVSHGMRVMTEESSVRWSAS